MGAIVRNPYRGVAGDGDRECGSFRFLGRDDFKY